MDSSTHVELSSGLLSKVVYAGRFSGIRGMEWNPEISFKHKSGVESSINSIIWPGFSPVITQAELTMGFSKTVTSWFGGGASYTRTFMFYGSDSDRLSMNNAVNLNLDIYLSWMNATIEYSYLFGYEKASGLHFAVSRDFIQYGFLRSDKFTLTPSVGVLCGPQSLFYYYFSKEQIDRVNHGKANSQGKSSGKGSASENTETTWESSTFQVLDYQMTISAAYRKGHYEFVLIYYLDIPQNLPVDYEYGTKPVSYLGGTIRYIF